MLNIRVFLRNVVKTVANLAKSKVTVAVEEANCINGAISKSHMSRVKQLMK